MSARCELAVVVWVAVGVGFGVSGCAVEDIVARQGGDPVAGLCACDGVVFVDPFQLNVAADLLSGGSLAGMLDVDVDGDAHVAGSLAVRDLRVDGTLHTPAAASITVTGVDAAPRRSSDVVDVRTRCDCDSGVHADIAALVQAAADDNDNAAIALDSAALANVQVAQAFTLPCGRFYLDAIGAAVDLELVVTGRALVFVAGDVALERSLTITVQAGALDLVVAGNVTVSGALSAGEPNAPVNLYVAGAGTLDLGGEADIGGLLYAPRSELVARASLGVGGALFVRRLSSNGDVTIGGRGAAPAGLGAPQCL